MGTLGSLNQRKRTCWVNGCDRCVALIHHDAPPASSQREVKADDTAGALETNLCMGARSRDRLASKFEDCVVIEPTNLFLGFVPMPGRFVVDPHARYGDLRPRHAEASMDRCEVLKVDGVLDELEDVHLYEPGIMLSPPNETAVIDLRKAFYVVRAAQGAGPSLTSPCW